MNDTSDRHPDLETPWEFLLEDGERMPTPTPAEWTALHVEPIGPVWSDDADTETGTVVVHYMDDEQPEVPDESVPDVPDDLTTPVDELLIRQHYIEPPGDS